MGEECPRVHRLAMSGQRPSDLGVTSVLTPVTFAPNVTTLNGEPSTGSARTSHVTMGAVSRPARRPDDGAGDAEVISRIRAGDRRAVDDLYDRFRLPAFALARRILADDALAEDVLQDVFLSIWRDPAAFDGARGSVASWLLAVVHHKAVDAVRREESQRRRQALVEGGMVLDEPVAARDGEGGGGGDGRGGAGLGSRRGGRRVDPRGLRTGTDGARRALGAPTGGADPGL